MFFPLFRQILFTRRKGAFNKEDEEMVAPTVLERDIFWMKHFL
jgi:hypothetical protein